MFSIEEKIKFIERALGTSTGYRGNQKDIAVKCPICNPLSESKKKLSIRITDDLTHCWVCGFSARSLLPILIKFSDRETIEEYKTKYLKYVEKYVEIEKQEPVKLPNDFKLLALELQSKDPDVKKRISYLIQRGISEKEMWRFKLGYSEISDYRGRIIIPSFSIEGKLNYLVARKISESTFGYKYINPKVRSSEIIFNELTINWKKELTLVEGAFDLIKVNENATCLLGSEINESGLLFHKILENNTSILLCLDNDMKLKSFDIIKKFESYGIQISAVDLGSYKDPGELPINKFDEIKNNKLNSSWENRLFEKINNIKDSSLGFGK